VDGVAGDGEKERFDRTNFVACLGPEQADVGFLGGVIGIRDTGQGLSQVGPEGIVVGLNLPGKPLGVVCVR